MTAHFQMIDYRPEFKAPVTDLLDGILGIGSTACNAYFEWKFERNPYMHEPLIYVALDGDNPVRVHRYLLWPGSKRTLSIISLQMAAFGR